MLLTNKFMEMTPSQLLTREFHMSHMLSFLRIQKVYQQQLHQKQQLRIQKQLKKHQLELLEPIL
jgi:hypothetical protein